MKKVSEIDTFLTDIALYFNEKACRMCGICEDVCPKEAIELGPSGAIGINAADMPPIVVDEGKCVLCGVCDAICPFRAFLLEVNGEHELPIVDLRAFSQLTETVKHDPDKCELEKKCVEACPVDAISAENEEWKIDMGLCVEPTFHCRPANAPGSKLGRYPTTCPWCEDACLNDAISVTKMFEGEIEIDASKCPGGCAVCLEICPNNAIYEPRAEKPWETAERIAVDEGYCIYCGACARACPVDAITIDRKIKTNEVESLIWNVSKDKLTGKISSMEDI